MTKGSFIGLVFMASLLCSMLWSCEQQRDPCLLPTAVNMRARCMQVINDTTLADTSLNNMILAAVDEDTLKYLYLGANEIIHFNLRLSPVHDSSMFLLQADSAASPIDTLVFHYGRTLQFLSNACGYTYFYELDSVITTRNSIDSVRIINRTVTNDVNTNPREHVQIYF